MELLLVVFAILLPAIVGLLILVVVMMSGGKCLPSDRASRLQAELSARYAADAERQREIQMLRHKLREASYGLAYFKNPNYWGGSESRWFWLGSGQSSPWHLFDDYAPRGEDQVRPLDGNGKNGGKHVAHK